MYFQVKNILKTNHYHNIISTQGKKKPNLLIGLSYRFKIREPKNILSYKNYLCNQKNIYNSYRFKIRESIESIYCQHNFYIFVVASQLQTFKK